jgi:hypothetical protein
MLGKQANPETPASSESSATELEARVAELEQKAAEPTDTEHTQAETISALLARQDRKGKAGLVRLGLAQPGPEPMDLAEGVDGEQDVNREPDFDAGVREPAPLPTDPAADHNEVVHELLAAKEIRRGGAWGWEG